MARREQPCSLPLISSNSASASSSWEKACTTFWFPTISSIRAVCSPLVSDCKWNMVNVFFAINPATKNDNGVTSTTTPVTATLTLSINPSVPKMVMTPVKNCVNPISSPSAN